MQRELAEIYKHLFSFLFEVARWFIKSSFSRFLDSFNKDVKKEHDAAVSIINEYIDIIAERGMMEGLLRIEDVRQTNDILEWKLDLLVPKIANIEQYLETIVDENRTQGQFPKHQLLAAGNLMLSLLSEQVDSKIRETLGVSRRNVIPALTKHDTRSISADR